MFVLVDNPAGIGQPFYAALDIGGGACWTDDLTRAKRFASESEAKQFGQNRMTNQDWRVVPA